LASPAARSPDGRQLSLSVGPVGLEQLAVDPAWAAERGLAIPPTIPALGAAPCTP
ncbi:MAG: hypothetical protein HGA45_32700, partial [Chloroflexales bacterium]|nr:hypothetical protein [Chloroflexales bacterium]